MDRYEPQDDRAEVAARLGGGAGVQRPEPGARRARGRRALVPARDAAVPVRERPAHGARPQLHDGGRRHARAPPQRLDGRAADGLGRVRAARGERRDPRGRPSARDHRAQHQDDPRADEAARLGDRLGPRGLVARSRLLLAGRSGCSSGSTRSGLAYRREAPVNWCPNDQTVVANAYIVDGHCERCGAQIELRNMTQWFFKTTAYADELREFDLPPGGELAGALGRRPAQLDRPLAKERRSSSASTSSTSTSRSSRRGPTRCSARRSSSSRPSTHSSRRTRATRRTSTRSTRVRSAPRSAQPRPRRPASSPATTRRTR